MTDKKRNPLHDRWDEQNEVSVYDADEWEDMQGEDLDDPPRFATMSVKEMTKAMNEAVAAHKAKGEDNYDPRRGKDKAGWFE